jgi:hypothetical protein
VQVFRLLFGTRASVRCEWPALRQLDGTPIPKFLARYVASLISREPFTESEPVWICIEAYSPLSTKKRCCWPIRQPTESEGAHTEFSKSEEMAPVAEEVIAHTSHHRSRWKNSPYGHCRSPDQLPHSRLELPGHKAVRRTPSNVDAVKMAIYPHLRIHLTTRRDFRPRAQRQITRPDSLISPRSLAERLGRVRPDCRNLTIHSVRFGR